MSKVLKIDKCNECPYYGFHVSDFYPPYPKFSRWCNKIKPELGKSLKTGEAISDKCPLDDWK